MASRDQATSAVESSGESSSLAPPPPLPPRNSHSSGASFANRPRSVSELPPKQQQPPPPLPKRSGSSSSSGHSAEVDELASHYAYLQKHVRQMRRANKLGLEPPDRKQFQVQVDENVSYTDWKAYAQAWIQYVIESFASGRVDESLEPFSLNIVKSGVDRLYTLAVPLKGPARWVRKVYRWQNVWLTSLMLFLYLILWYYDLIPAFFCACWVAYIVMVRLDMFAEYGVEALATSTTTQEDTPATRDSKMKQFWRRLKYDVGSAEYHQFSALEDRSLHDWLELKRKYGPKGQLLLLDMVDQLERVKNLITWKNPDKTRLFLWLLCVWVVFLAIMPQKYTAKLFFLWLGFEFFVLQPLRSHYPRHRRLFNITDWLLWGVPNDAEYALQVIRLRRQEEDPDQLFHKSMPELQVPNNRRRYSEQEQEKGEKLDNPPSQSTAATVAMMVAGAVAGEMKRAFDDQVNKSRHTNDLLEEKTSQRGVPKEPLQVIETYSCMYKASIPGRIILASRGFQFRTSRMTGGRILVFYEWHDIVGVKKTKSIDVLLWHTNGLIVTTADGEQHAAWRRMFSATTNKDYAPSHYYRALLKAGYAAVSNVPYQKVFVRERIRRKFQQTPADIIDQQQIKNTVAFLKIAATRKGLEHDIVRNICDLEYHQTQYQTRPPYHNKKMSPEKRQFHDNAYDEINLLIDMLNKELNLCL